MAQIKCKNVSHYYIECSNKKDSWVVKHMYINFSYVANNVRTIICSTDIFSNFKLLVPYLIWLHISCWIKWRFDIKFGNDLQLPSNKSWSESSRNLKISLIRLDLYEKLKHRGRLWAYSSRTRLLAHQP